MRFILNDLVNPLIKKGMTAQLATRRARIAAGENMARDLPGGVTAKAAAAAIKEIMPAIELADLDPLPAPDNLDKVLEGDVYQRMCATRCEHARRRLDRRPHLTPDPTRSGNGAQHRSGSADRQAYLLMSSLMSLMAWQRSARSYRPAISLSPARLHHR